MKVPASPPDLWTGSDELLTKATAAGSVALTEFARRTALAQPVDEKGRYLHWEDFRFKPGEDGLSAKDRWLLMRRARETRRVNTPFADKRSKVFFFVKTDFIERALHEIDSRTHGGVRFEGSAPTRDEARAFLVRSLIEEPFSSSLFEGAVATRDQAKKLIRENQNPRTPGERMIINNYRAIEFLKERTGDPLTPDMICELHRLITHDTLENPRKAGVFRNADDNIVVDDKAGDVLHHPPHADELPARAAALCRFANEDLAKGAFIHPILRAIILHFMLAYDHPFVDGNGRTARALFYWSALKHGYWLLEFISISKQIREAPVQYGKAFLETETDEGDLTYFINNQLDMILKAIKALEEFIDEKKSEVADLERALTSSTVRRTLNHRQIALLHDGARAAGMTVTIADHQRMTGVSYLTARADLEGLAGSGFFAKRKRGAMSVYFPARDIAQRLAAAVRG